MLGYYNITNIRFNYNTTAYPFGIHSYEYIADASMFANGTENPDNACYNPQDVFLPSGVYNTSICRSVPEIRDMSS